MKSLSEMGFISVESMAVGLFKATRKVRDANLSVEICENIIRLLDNKALSASQAASRLNIACEGSRLHLLHLGRVAAYLEANILKGGI